MELEKLRVQNHKSIDDTGWVGVDDLTCLVGKNESGKTAFLEAIEKINPEVGGVEYDDLTYPISNFVEYERRREEGEPADIAASAKFRLTEEELEMIESEYSEDILDSSVILVRRDRGGELHWDIDVSESIFIEDFIEKFEIEYEEVESNLKESNDFDELLEKIEESDITEDLEEIRDEVESGDTSQTISQMADEIGSEYLRQRLPKFRYIGKYSVLDSIININSLLDANEEDIEDSEAVFLDLLSVGDISLNDLTDEPNWERVIRRLEAAQGEVTDYMLDYWSQNENIRIRFNREEAAPEGPSEYDSGQLLQVRVENQRINATMDFDQRSLGFRWFFSSFCKFTNIRDADEDLVLLLDEPGLHLHAKAQQDFLKFLDNELSEIQQVIYTTHSPFMIDPKKIHQTKLVVQESDSGTIISSDVLRTDEDTRLPLETVFEFDMIDTLLIRPYTLLVEGKSDQIYIYLMSKILEENGGTGLNDRWTVINVGSGDNISTFVSLFGGNDLNLGVLLDRDGSYTSRVDNITDLGEIEEHQIFPASDFVPDQDYADIEDLFSLDFYLNLVSETYMSELAADYDLPDRISESEFEDDNMKPRIVKRLETYFDRQDINNGRFEHAAPARQFQDNFSQYLDEIDENSIDNFQLLYNEFNSLLEDI